MIDSIDLGLVKAIHIGLTSPSNTVMLWYDDNISEKIHKWYNTLTSTWEPLVPTVASSGWQLDGNSNGAEKYFGTNDNHDIPLYTNGLVRGVFDKGGNFGFGTTSSSARVHIKGVDATSSNYALKVDNSASSPLLYVRNDGNVGIGIASATAKLEIFDSSLAIQKWAYNSINKGAVFLTPNASSSLGISTLFNDKLTFGRFNVSGSANGFGFVLESTSGDFTISPDYSGAIDFIYKRSNQNFGLGEVSPDAKLHVKGVSATSSNYALKVDNSASSPLLYVRNDGFVGIGTASPAYRLSVQITNGEIGTLLTDNSTNLVQAIIGSKALFGTTSAHDLQFVTTGTSRMTIKAGGVINASLQTGNSGLSTGDMYVDTAANILANGDKVVGWKV